MPSSLYYPRTPTSSQTFVAKACPTGMSSDDFEQKFLSTNRISTGKSCVLPPDLPVIVPSARDGSCVSTAPIRACTPSQQRTLAHLSQYAGGDAVLGLAQLLWDTKIPDIVGDLNTFGGTGMSTAAAISNKVLAAVNKYDIANKQYEDLKNHRAAPATLNAAKAKADAAFKEMNKIFNEKSMKYLNNSASAMRETTNATGKAVWESIPVVSTADVQKLTKLAKIARVAGPGVVLIDGFLRANDVHHRRKNKDSDWEKHAVMQGSGFTMALVTTVAISAFLAATPVGLAVGIVVGGFAGVGSDRLVKEVAGWAYDQW